MRFVRIVVGIDGAEMVRDALRAGESPITHLATYGVAPKDLEL